MTILRETVKDATVFPVLEVIIDEAISGRRYLLPSACFQDLFGVPDEELAGVGLAIIGNVCKLMREGESGRVPLRLTPTLQLRCAMGAEPIPVPWPGMPDDNPTLPLRPELMPFESAMFLTDDHDFKHRVDRMALMHRIEAIWVPWLKAKLFAVV